MTTLILAASLLGQCAGGSCAAPAYRPAASFVAPAVRYYPAPYRAPAIYYYAAPAPSPRWTYPRSAAYYRYYAAPSACANGRCGR